MYANVWPDVLKYLLKHKNMSKEVFIAKSKVEPKTFYRWINGHNRVGQDFGKLAQGFDLTEDQLGYIHAWFQMHHYEADRIPIDYRAGGESEIREPAPAYDLRRPYVPPTALERARKLVRLDNTEVPVEMAPALTLLRNKIKILLEKKDSALEELEKELRELVELCEGTFAAAKDVKRQMEKQRGD